MNMVDVRKRNLGAICNQDGSVEITVWAPHARQLEIQFADGGREALAKAPFGYFTVTTNQLRAGDLYQLVINGDKVFPDPFSLSQPEGVHGRSRVVDLHQFQWTD